MDGQAYTQGTDYQIAGTTTTTGTTGTTTYITTNINIKFPQKQLQPQQLNILLQQPQ